MKFSELLSKITLTGENQVATKKAIEKGNDLLKAAEKNNEFIRNKESKVQCRVNGKVRKVRPKKEEITEENKEVITE